MSKVFHRKFRYMVKPLPECKVVFREMCSTEEVPTKGQTLIAIDVRPTEGFLSQKSYVVFSQTHSHN